MGQFLWTTYIIDVVGIPIGITIDGISLKLQLVTVEEHDGNIDTVLAGGNDPGPHAVEVALVEFGEVEFQAAVVGNRPDPFSATSREALRCFHLRRRYPRNLAVQLSTTA